jgi:hypothetical protein
MDHEHSEHKHKVHHKTEHKDKAVTKPIIALLVIATLAILFNQYQINAISGMVTTTSHSGSSRSHDLGNINLAELKSTGHTIAAVFPVEDIHTADDAMAIMFPVGTPDYGADLGVSYDDPVGSLDTLAKMFNALKAEVQQNNPEAFDRFVNLASNPYGVSCEYCCGIGPAGADASGNSRCGCSHNPGILSATLYLAAYTDYSDGEILREAMKWKTLWFPKNMIELGLSLAGGDTSALSDLPGMVGGC